MRSLLVFLCLLIISVAFGIWAFSHPGYLWIWYAPWTIRMPLWLGILAVVFCGLVLYGLIQAFNRMRLFYVRMKYNWCLRKERNAQFKLLEGIQDFLGGYWLKAETNFLRSINSAVVFPQQSSVYLLAANAADQRQAYGLRESYLKRAFEVNPQAKLSIGLLRIECAIRAQQFEHGLAIAQDLQQDYRNHPQLLNLMRKIYETQANWEMLISLLPQIYKTNLLHNRSAYYTYEEYVYLELITSKIGANSRLNLSDLRKLWLKIPRYLRAKTEFSASYVRAIAQYVPVCGIELSLEIETLVKRVLKEKYYVDLVIIYASLTFSDYNKPLKILNQWLQVYGEQPELLYGLAKMCIQLKLWGRAREYLTRCLALGGNLSAAFSYGQLLEQLGDTKSALAQYRAALYTLLNTNGVWLTP